MNSTTLWEFLPRGYALTVLIELPILLIGLSQRHPWRERFIAGFTLTAATYPIVVIVMPLMLGLEAPRWLYLSLAETFAPLAECALFGWLFVSVYPRDVRATLRDMSAIVLANVASFVIGELFFLIVE